MNAPIRQFAEALKALRVIDIRYSDTPSNHGSNPWIDTGIQLDKHDGAYKMWIRRAE